MSGLLQASPSPVTAAIFQPHRVTGGDLPYTGQVPRKLQETCPVQGKFHADCRRLSLCRASPTQVAGDFPCAGQVPRTAAGDFPCAGQVPRRLQEAFPVQGKSHAGLQETFPVQGKYHAGCRRLSLCRESPTQVTGDFPCAGKVTLLLVMFRIYNC